MENKYHSSIDQLTDFIDIRRLLSVILENIISIIIICVIFFSLWWVYVSYTTPQYMVRSLIQIDNKNVADAFTETQTVFNIVDNNNLQEQSAIFKSRTNLTKLIEKLDINYSVNNINSDVYKRNFFNKVEIIPKRNLENYEVDVELFDTFYKVTNLNSDSKINYDYGKTYEHNNLSLNISRDIDLPYKNDKISIQYFDKDFALSLLEAQINVGVAITSGPISLKNSLLFITYSNPDVEFAKKVVNTMNDIFLEQSVARNSERASASLTFLESRKEQIESLLKLSEIKLNTFQEENLFYEQGEEGKILLVESRNIDNQLNALELEEVEVRSNFSSSSDVLKNLDAQKSLLKAQKGTILEKISNLPAIEQEYINLLREVEINQNILENLLNKIIEFSIIEASTISDVRLIDSAYYYGMVAPRPLFSLGITLVSIFVAVLSIILVQFLFFRKLKKPSDLFDVINTDMFLGTIAKSDTTVFENLADRDKEAILSLGINIDTSGQKENNTCLMVTGPTKGVGKTTIAYFLSRSLLQQGKTVALIDCDFRQGDLHKIYNVKKAKDYDGIISVLKNESYSNDEVFFIPRLSNKSDRSIATFNSEKFAELINTLKSKFDYLVIDTPPLLSLSDSISLSQFSDINIVVVSHNKTWFNDYNSVVQTFSAIDDKPLKTVYNFFERRPFTYNYNYYDSYAYSYYGKSYDYESD